MVEAILITVFFVLFAILSIKRPFWGIISVSVLLPTYLIRFSLFDIPFTLLEGMIIILTLVFLVKQIVRKELADSLRRFLASKFAFPILLLLIAATVAIFVTPDRSTALGIWKAYFIEPALFFFVLTSIVKTKKQLGQIIIALVASASFIALTAIVQYFAGWGIPESYSLEGARRATSFYGFPAAVGLFIAPILSLLLAWLITSGKKVTSNYKIWLPAGLAAIAMMLALLFARTEGAWLGVLIATFFVFMFTRYRLPALTVCLIALMLVLAIPVARDYFVTLATFQDVSGDVRLVLWQGTTRLIADNPVFGAGLAGFPELYEKYKEARHVELSLYPHNIFLNFWSETGALGLIALLLILFQYIKQGLKALSSRYSLPLLAAMSCILIYGLVDAPYFKNDLSVLFWIFIGLMILTTSDVAGEEETKT